MEDKVILIHLESYGGTYAQDVGERNRMNPDMRNFFVHEISESHVVKYVQSKIDGHDSEEIS